MTTTVEGPEADLSHPIFHLDPSVDFERAEGLRYMTCQLCSRGSLVYGGSCGRKTCCSCPKGEGN